MKCIKVYKISVPESYILSKKELYDIGNFGSFPKDNVVTRQEIHELVKAHAEKLGYDVEDIVVGLSGNILINNNPKALPNDFITINWQDFLKFTSEDVKIEPVQIFNRADFGEKTNSNKQALLEAFTAGWDAAHNNRFSIGVNFDKWYHEKEGNK